MGFHDDSDFLYIPVCIELKCISTGSPEFLNWGGVGSPAEGPEFEIEKIMIGSGREEREVTYEQLCAFVGERFAAAMLEKEEEAFADSIKESCIRGQDSD